MTAAESQKTSRRRAATEGASEKRGPGRPRSSRSHEAILKAVGRILRTHGLQGLTVDAVVSDARVSKGTVYRWWESKHAVAMDAILRIFNAELQTPDTGSTIEDFRSLMKQFAALLQSDGLGYTYVTLLVDAQQNQRIEEFHRRFFAERREVLYGIIHRGVSKGELIAQADPDLIVDILFGPIIFRLLTGLHAIDEEMIDDILAAVSRGLVPPSRGITK
jgi:AcrR family transcriptional regulator